SPRFLQSVSLFFFFIDSLTTHIYTLSLHDALPISLISLKSDGPESLAQKSFSLIYLVTASRVFLNKCRSNGRVSLSPICESAPRSEEHTSELQSLAYLVCRLLLEKKKK